jgi:hypothetical protein
VLVCHYGGYGNPQVSQQWRHWKMAIRSASSKTRRIGRAVARMTGTTRWSSNRLGAAHHRRDQPNVLNPPSHDVVILLILNQAVDLFHSLRAASLART